jgi:F-type H+-transporting ATPase subunit epsilon
MADDKQKTDGQLTVNVVTPTGPITVGASTNAVTAPGELGEFEVLPGHIPFLTSLHPGVMSLGEGKNAHIYAVSRGYVRVSMDGEVEVLVERAVAAGKVDTEQAKADLGAAQKELVDWKDKPQDANWRNIKDRHDWAQARLDAAARV